MGNKLIPRHIIGTAGPIKVNTIIKRSQMLVLNNGTDGVGFTPDATETSFSDCYPVGSGVEFTDTSQSDIYAISETGNLDLWIFETEV